MHRLQSKPKPGFCNENSLVTISRFIARQSAKPAGLFGRLIFGRLLNRANASVNQLVYDNLQHEANSRVLEIGFGGGDLLFRIARSLSGGRIDGVDVSVEMLANAQRKLSGIGLEETVGLQLGSVDTLPFAKASFDCACSVHTIYFWPDLNAGLRELARVVKPGGGLVLGFSSDSALIEDGCTARGFRAYSSQQIVEACLACGFALDRLVTTGRKRGGEIFVYRGIRQRE
jgi:ubiquinone/menaquinone biosynthesis C-methylase UbiE